MKDAKQNRSSKGLLRVVRPVFRWTWFPLACISSLAIGLTIGYVFLGKQSAADMFSMGTWTHIFDLVFADL